MKKIGKWYIPDRDIGKERLVNDVLSENFQCQSGLEKAFKYVKNFENAIDVGTWIGDSTKIISKKFKNVKGFEANPIVFECCVENMKIHNITNCELILKGLSNVTGIQQFINKGKTFSGWISTVDLEGKDLNNSIKIETCRLDDLSLNNIDFIKIDVDSHEGFLISGAIEFFKNNSPVIMIESKYREHELRQDGDMPDPIKLLQELKYKVVATHGKADFILVKQE